MNTYSYTYEKYLHGEMFDILHVNFDRKQLKINVFKRLLFKDNLFKNTFYLCVFRIKNMYIIQNSSEIKTFQSNRAVPKNQVFIYSF